MSRPRRSSTSPNLNESLSGGEKPLNHIGLNTIKLDLGPPAGGDSRGFLLGADGALRVDGRAGVEHPLGQVDEGVVPVADCQPLCLEQNAGLAIVGDAQRAVGPHQRLEQLPLVVRQPRLVPVKRLRTQENGAGCESRKGNAGNAFIHQPSDNVALLLQGPGNYPRLLPSFTEGEFGQFQH